jgi:hypothetical protein
MGVFIYYYGSRLWAVSAFHWLFLEVRVRLVVCSYDPRCRLIRFRADFICLMHLVSVCRVDLGCSGLTVRFQSLLRFDRVRLWRRFGWGWCPLRVCVPLLASGCCGFQGMDSEVGRGVGLWEGASVVCGRGGDLPPSTS